MATEMITLRVTSEQKQRLETLARQHGCSNSDIIRAWIDKPDMMIPPNLLEQIQSEAAQRGYSEVKIIEKALRYAFKHRFIGSSRSLRTW